MEVLLLTDIPGIGKKNDLLVVGDGFALNYLLPTRRALVVTPNIRRHYAEKIKQRALERERERTLQASTIQALRGKRLQLTASATSTGKLYAAITRDSLVQAIASQLNVAVMADQIQLSSPLKVTGTHTVTISSPTDSATVTVEVHAAAPPKAKSKKKGI